MQLTKDDVKKLDVAELFTKERKITKVLNYSKFQQVVEFYEKYRYKPDDLFKQDKELRNQFVKYHNDYYECDGILNDKGTKFWTKKMVIHMIHNDGHGFTFYQDWFFDYCFKDGLK